MANQIKKKFIADGAIDGLKIQLEKNQALKGKLQDGSVADLIKLDANDKVLLKGAEAALKSQLDSVESALDGRLDVIEGSGSGSIAKALQDAKDYTDAEIAAIPAVDLSGVVKRDGSTGAMTAALNMGGFKIENVADGVASANAVNKGQLDAVESALDGRLDVVEPKVTTLEGEMDTAQADIDALEAKLGAANGIATLDGAGKVPSAQLPSYVDDVVEYAAQANFPATGETGKIYVALDTNKCYRWSGSQYILITSGAVDSVNGKQGAVSLDAGDIFMDDGVTLIQSKLVSLQGEIDAAEGDIAAVESDITNIQSDISALQSADSALDGRLDTLEPKVSTLESEMDAVQADVVSLDGRLDTAEPKISTLESEMNAVEAEVDALQALAFVKEKIVVGATLTHIDLAHEAKTNSCIVFVDRLALHQDEDFTVSVVGGKTRLTWAGEFAVGGTEAVETGYPIYITYYK